MIGRLLSRNLPMDWAYTIAYTLNHDSVGYIKTLIHSLQNLNAWHCCNVGLLMFKYAAHPVGYIFYIEWGLGQLFCFIAIPTNPTFILRISGHLHLYWPQKAFKTFKKRLVSLNPILSRVVNLLWALRKQPAFLPDIFFYPKLAVVLSLLHATWWCSSKSMNEGFREPV